MSSETSKSTSQLTASAAADYGLNLNETELTLGLPGESRGRKSGTKRRFSETIDLKLSNDDDDSEVNQSDTECSDATKPPPLKVRVIGWPPLNLHRKNVVNNFKFVKVAVDGAPYLRKVDLESYAGYHQLQCALDDIFFCFTNDNVLNEKKLIDPVNGVKFITTYEDKDGDWMLVGDVPWKMFVDSCKRIRLMRSSESINELAPRTPSKCSSC